MSLLSAFFITCLTNQDKPAVLVKRPAMHYVGIKTTVKMDGIKDFMQSSVPKIFSWLKDHKIEPDGPEFLRYTFVDMQKGLDLEMCVPVKKATKGDKSVRAGIIPAGRYASMTHFGDFAGLYGTNGAIQDWIKSKNLAMKMQKGKKGDEFTSRLEIYKVGPWNQPDMAKWETEVLFMVK